ncbi:uncharacterized protein LOC144121448 [Amblyomma americanum]
MPYPSLILSVALAASFVPLSNLSRTGSRVRKGADPPEFFADTLTELKKLMVTKLHEDQVIPEVITETPEQPVAVFYPYAKVMMGNHIDPPTLRFAPQFFFKSKPDRLYTLMLLGPDYPTREAHTERNRLMWCVTNFARFNATYTLRPIGLVSYEQPKPASNSGKMRFVFLVYEQPTDKDWRKKLIETPRPPTNFMLDWYVDRNGLTLAAVNYFIIDTGLEGTQSNSSLGRVTGEETRAVTGDGGTTTGGKNSDSGAKKTSTRKNEAGIGEKTTDAGAKVARTGEKTDGPGEKEARSDGKSTGAGAIEAGTGEKATSAGGMEARAGEKMISTVEKGASGGAKATGIGSKKPGTEEKATGAVGKVAGEKAIGTGGKEAGAEEKATGAGGEEVRAGEKTTNTVEKKASGGAKATGIGSKEAGTEENATGAVAKVAGTVEEANNTGAKNAGSRDKATATSENEVGTGEKATGTALKEAMTRENKIGSEEKQAGTFKKQAVGYDVHINASKNVYAGARLLQKDSEETRTEARRVEMGGKEARAILNPVGM